MNGESDKYTNGFRIINFSSALGFDGTVGNISLSSSVRLTSLSFSKRQIFKVENVHNFMIG